MATLKHLGSKNADYGAAEQYLLFEHDEFTMKPVLDENGRLIPREDYRLSTLNCGGEDFAVACMRSNLRYEKNQRREDVKSHHYIISFDPRDGPDNGLTVDRAQALGEQFCKEHFPGHQALVCTHPDGHNHSGNIHVHIVINSLRIEEVPFLPYMDRPADTKAGCKHRCTDAALRYFKSEVMEMCHREGLYQIDLLNGSKNRVTDREYWAQKKGQAALDKQNAPMIAGGITPRQTKFETNKEKLRQTLRNCIYGYKKDPNDKDHWIIDEEAAEVVRRIYRMALESKGPYEIARILALEKVERPSYYLAQRGVGKHQSNFNPAERYTWRGGTVADILSKPEYMGHTVNFRTYKESYKDKRSRMTPKEDLVIFENTQEAIIDKETWERVQSLRKTIRRTDTIGAANPLTGLMFCADCGAKMYNHRGGAGLARDWAGRPNGRKRPERDEYNCSRYDLGNQHYNRYCTTHLIRTAVVNELLLEAIKEVCDYALNNEAAFMEQVCSASSERQVKAAKAIRQRKQRSEKRADELSRLIRKLYEDNVNGRLSDKLFEQMLHDFEAELESLTESVTQDEQELDRISRETVNAEKFLALVKKYTDFSELTPAMINEFVEKILVHQAEGKGASRTQEVEIFFNFVGKVEIPHEEIALTEEEKAALAEQERRRAKKAEYNRRYMEKKRRQWREQREREQEQKPHKLHPVADEKGEKSA